MSENLKNATDDVIFYSDGYLRIVLVGNVEQSDVVENRFGF